MKNTQKILVYVGMSALRKKKMNQLPVWITNANLTS